MRRRIFALTMGVLAVAGSAQAAGPRDRLYDPAAGVLVVAHRACHAPAPSRGMTGELPENSLAALERCIALGVDVVEIDVRRTQDGALVVMHDAKVDRTTTGKGKVSDLTLGELQALRLKVGDQAFEAPPTLCAFLRAARGRVVVNLDLRDEGPTAAQVARVVRDTGAQDWVLFKARAEAGAGPIADQPLYQNLAFVPIVGGKGGARRAAQLAVITAAQARGARPIPAVEMDALNKDAFVAVRDAAQAARVRLWSNTLNTGDRHALTDPDKAWGDLIAEGVSIVQTDQPAALLDYLHGQGLRGLPSVTVADARSPSPAASAGSPRSR
ncbi:glycerophosphodiester phosphodiesterase family protein [uncultured Caulobacter sp.]|uniref:glycerophosphodiester phosphodiesterase family protein n=1 Tax=uncultured Caulobacter sp. TaxID=158749 RepID=UPI00262875B6|nr:glycerophosphodiester phosphodiesterase family protein [uncultured Caulobacter sp.]